MSVAQATHQEVLATQMLRNDQNENLGAERFCRRKKQNVARDQEIRDPETTQKGQGQVWVQILALSFSNCAALSKFLQRSVPPFPHLKPHLVRRITEEEVGKAGWSAGQCLTPGCLTKGVRGGW